MKKSNGGELPRVNAAPFQTPEHKRKEVVQLMRAIYDRMANQNAMTDVALAALMNVIAKIVAQQIPPNLRVAVTEQLVLSLPLYVKVYEQGERS